MSLSKDIAEYLISEGMGDAGEWGIYFSTEPPLPDKAVTVYRTGGAQDNADGPYYQPNIQVRVRANSADEAELKSEEIRDLLLIPTARIIGDTFVTGFWLVTDIQMIGRDDNNRAIYTVNFRLMTEPHTTE